MSNVIANRLLGPVLATLALLVGCDDGERSAATPVAAESALRADVAATVVAAVAIAADAVLEVERAVEEVLAEITADEEEVAVVVEEEVAVVVEEEVVVVEEEEVVVVVEEEVDLLLGAFADWTLYLDPNSNPADQAIIWEVSDPVGAAHMEIIADQPVALWIGDWYLDVTDTVDDAMDDAGDELRVFVSYNIPDRDCGNWSAGGAQDATEYAAFIQAFADGLEGRPAIVILEPDALAVVECLDDAGEADRLSMMSDAVDVLTAAGASVYIDAGDSNWIPSEDMADQLLAAGVENAAGFALNVSHTEFSANETAYAEEIRAIIGTDAHYVMDTSRNGNGPTWDNEWCNPQGVALGEFPTLTTGVDGLDGYLWIKPPGESDGECYGGPAAGGWWPEYASDLAAAAGL